MELRKLLEGYIKRDEKTQHKVLAQGHNPAEDAGPNKILSQGQDMNEDSGILKPPPINDEVHIHDK